MRTLTHVDKCLEQSLMRSEGSINVNGMAT